MAGERLTINLDARASKALNFIVASSGVNKTRAICSALRFYAKLLGVIKNGGEVLIREPGRAPRVVEFFDD